MNQIDPTIRCMSGVFYETVVLKNDLGVVPSFLSILIDCFKSYGLTIDVVKRENKKAPKP